MSNESITNESQAVTKRALLLIIANICATALSFAMPLVLVRVLNQFDYGLYKQAFQILLTALGLLNLQVAASVYYFSARVPEKKLQVAQNVIVFYTLAGVILGLIFLVWPGWAVLVFQTADLVPYIPLIGLVILLWLVSTNLEVVPIVAGDVRLASGIIILSQLTRAILMIGAALIFGGLKSILIAAMIQGAIQTATMIGYIRYKYGRLLVPLDWPLFKSQIGSSLPFGVGSIAATMQRDLHNYFVSYYFDAATFAVYSVGCFQLPVLGMLASSFAYAVNPELARHKEANDLPSIINTWMDVVRKLAFFFLPAFAVMFVLRQEFIITLFTRTYKDSVPIFAINLFSILISITLHEHLLRLFDELRFFRVKLYLGLIPMTWGMFYLGYQIYGLLGVVIAVVITQALDIGITLTMVAQRLHMKGRDLYLLSPLMKIGAAAGAAALVTFVTKLAYHHLHPLPQLIVGGAIFSVAYLLFVFAVGAVTREERRYLKYLISKYYAMGATRLRLFRTA